jgi:hypothetical protein
MNVVVVDVVVLKMVFFVHVHLNKKGMTLGPYDARTFSFESFQLLGLVALTSVDFVRTSSTITDDKKTNKTRQQWWSP